MVKEPYLIQAGKFKHMIDTDIVSLESMIDFRYMGAAEFEFGSVAESLRRIVKESSNYILFSTELIDIIGKRVFIFCKKSEVSVMMKMIIRMKERKIRLKVGNWFARRFEDDQIEAVDDFYWDIKNDYFFWIGEEMNQEIRKAIDALSIKRNKERVAAEKSFILTIISKFKMER